LKTLYARNGVFVNVILYLIQYYFEDNLFDVTFEIKRFTSPWKSTALFIFFANLFYPAPHPLRKIITLKGITNLTNRNFETPSIDNIDDGKWRPWFYFSAKYLFLFCHLSLLLLCYYTLLTDRTPSPVDLDSNSTVTGRPLQSVWCFRPHFWFFKQ